MSGDWCNAKRKIILVFDDYFNDCLFRVFRYAYLICLNLSPSFSLTSSNMHPLLLSL
jgi:hypothetical protein